MSDFPEMSYQAAMRELFGLANSGELPEPVIGALLSLLQRPEKLFTWHPNANLAAGVGASDFGGGLQASDLLVKLVEAARTFDWEVIIIAGKQHGVSPDLESTLAD